MHKKSIMYEEEYMYLTVPIPHTHKIIQNVRPAIYKARVISVLPNF